ncbi:MAG: phosphatase PAP2 family protein [Ignavibacteriales bacterium]|nr:phosphatase PAP2 family protein [Ignavibacteriales bacterium]
MKTNFASVISIIGHPLLTLSIFAIIALFAYEEFQRAFLHSSFIVAGIFLPLAIKMYLNYKNGTYTNFDVSDKTQRQSWYGFAILILLIVTIILFATDQPRTLRLSVLFSLILVVTSQIVNYFIKSSLHVSFNIFLSFLIVPMNFIAGLLFLVFTILIAWARLTLKRHTIKEIIAGAFIGLIIGISSLLCIGKIANGQPFNIKIDYENIKIK